jgi:hypothetical protein
MHQATWLHKTHKVGVRLYSAIFFEGLVRHNRKATHRHRNPDGLPFLDVSDGRIIEESNALSSQLFGVRLPGPFFLLFACAWTVS